MKNSSKFLEHSRTLSDTPLYLQKDALNFPEFEGSARQIRGRYAA